MLEALHYCQAHTGTARMVGEGCAPERGLTSPGPGLVAFLRLVIVVRWLHRRLLAGWMAGCQ